MIAAWSVRAPEGAVAWVPQIGWTTDDHAIRAYAEPVYAVAEGEVAVDDPLVSAVMRIDADRDDLHARMVDVFEFGHERLAEARR